MKISNLSFLENIEEIKKLKYFYFQACDTNNLIQIKNTFASRDLSIDFEKSGKKLLENKKVKKHDSTDTDMYLNLIANRMSLWQKFCL